MGFSLPLDCSWGGSCAWQRVARLGSSKSDGKGGWRRRLLLDVAVSRRPQAKIGLSFYKLLRPRSEDEHDGHLYRTSTRSRVGSFWMCSEVAEDIARIPLKPSTRGLRGIWPAFLWLKVFGRAFPLAAAWLVRSPVCWVVHQRP